MNPWYLLAALGLLVANGFFVAAEFALTAARRSKIEQLATAGGPAARAAHRSLRELSLMLAGAQLGITMASLGLGYTAEPAVAAGLEELLGDAGLPHGLVESLAFVLALTVVVFFHMVVGEMAPKNVAIAEPERTTLLLALPFRAYVWAFGPFIRLLNLVANASLRSVGVEPVEEIVTAHTSAEFRAMIDESAREGLLEDYRHRLLSGAIGLSGLDAAAAMVPRTEMVAAPADATPSDLERLVLRTGLSRIPIFLEHLDRVIGFFHAKDLLKVAGHERSAPVARRLIRPMLVVPESRKLYPLLLDMRRQRRHFALVVDEHGGTSGVVTLEDVVEELVGEIRDEYDPAELDVETLGPDRYLVPGSLRIDQAATRLGVELPRGDYDTIAGFIMDRLGHIPRRRELVDHGGWRLQVRSMQRRRVVQVLIERTEPG